MGTYTGTKEMTITIAIDLADINQSVVLQDGDIITGKLNSEASISIADGATVTLSGVTIDPVGNGSRSWPGIICQGNATIILADGTENYVRSYTRDCPGIYIPRYKTLTFDGNGALDVAPNVGVGVTKRWIAVLIPSSNDKHYKLMTDISVTETMANGVEPVTVFGIGDERPFRGTFDGNGHTITLNYINNREEHYCGPFRIINGATIKNLHVTGTIVKATWKHAGGIVGKALGTNYITNCRSSVDIQVKTDGDCSSGGFIGDLRDGTTTLTGCTFDGKLRGPGGTKSRSTKWGGFIGWVAKGNKAILNTCVFTPAEIKINNTKDCRTFARRDDGDDVTLAGRTLFHDTNWNTLCLPFDVAKFDGTPLAGATVMELDTENFYTADGTHPTSINTHRAYFKLGDGLTAGEPADPNTSGVRSFNLHFGDGSELTGIVSVSKESGSQGVAGAWYSLDGRRLNGTPTKGGLYINNGRKVVVK